MNTVQFLTEEEVFGLVLSIFYYFVCDKPYRNYM